MPCNEYTYELFVNYLDNPERKRKKGKGGGGKGGRGLRRAARSFGVRQLYA